MGRLKLGIILIVGALALYFFSGKAPERTPKKLPVASGRQVKIGVIGPMTGSEFPKGKNGIKGIETVLHRKPLLNNGDKVEIQVEDDKGDPRLTLFAFKKLIQTHNVDAVILLSSTPSALEINRIVDQYKTPVLATIASHQDIAVDTRFMNQLCIDNRFQGKVAALYARDELFITRAAVFENPDNAYSVSLARIFQEQFIGLGGRMFEPLAFPGDEKELKDQLKMLKDNGVEMLYLPLGAPQFISISRILSEMSWSPVRMGSDGLLSNILMKHEESLDLVNGAISIDFYSTDARRSYFGSSLAKNYLKLFSETATTYTIAAAEGFALILNAMERCYHPITREDINTQIRNTGKFSGFIGRVRINSDGKSQRPLIVNAIQDGKLKMIVRVH